MKKNLKIALIGSSGYIAGYLLEKFTERKIEVIKIDQTPESDYLLNLGCAENFDYDILQDVDFVIFTAAISSPDKCAQEFDLCWQINVSGTSYFISEALKRNCRVLFFSSDAVFGESEKIFDELSETRAITAYGKMKQAVEANFKNERGFKAIRLSYVVSEKDKFVSYCLKCIKDSVKAEVFHPFYRNCITVSDVVKTVIWLLQHWEEFPSTLLNVAGMELVSRIRIADELNRIFHGSLKYDVKIPNEQFFINRPKITQMGSLYLYNFGILDRESFTKKIQKEFIK